MDCTLGLRHEVKEVVAVRCKIIVRRGFVLQNRSRPAKRRQALLESNLPRNSRLELIEADEHWE
jgi:hypothetical protein